MTESIYHSFGVFLCVYIFYNYNILSGFFLVLNTYANVLWKIS